jgi:biotin carboxylase
VSRAADRGGTHAAGLAGKRLLILGGGLWQLEYVRRARQLGIETWVTDWSAEAPARDDADHFQAIDLKDREATLCLARDAEIDAVLTAADIGVPTAAYICEQIGLPGYSRELAECATNKFLMRQRAVAAGIACPRYTRVRSADEAAIVVNERSLPAIVKPVDNCSSRGVRWVDRAADVPAAVAAALEASHRGEALVEQFLVGTEGSIEAFVQQGQACVLGFCDKTKSPLPDRFDLELRYPGDYGDDVRREIESLAQRIVDGFGIVDAIVHIEFLVTREPETVHLIEFAIRGCGSKVTTHLMPALTGVDLVGAVIRQAFGLRTTIEPSTGHHGALHFLMFPRGRVKAVRGVEQARQLAGVIDAMVERRAGDAIGEVRDGRSRPGHVLVEAQDRESVQQLLAAVRKLIRIDFEHQPDVAPLDCHESRVA